MRNGENELLRMMHDDMCEWTRCDWLETVREYRGRVRVQVNLGEHFKLTDSTQWFLNDNYDMRTAEQ